MEAAADFYVRDTSVVLSNNSASMIRVDMNDVNTKNAKLCNDYLSQAHNIRPITLRFRKARAEFYTCHHIS